MSKSLGNLISIKEALEKYSPDAIRIFILSSHYRSPLTYSEEALEAAQRGAERLQQVVSYAASSTKSGKEIDTNYYRQEFIKVMDDDFNTAQALALLFDLAREINRYDSEGIEAKAARTTLKELGDEVMGLTFKQAQVAPLDAELIAQISKSIYKELNLGASPSEEGAEKLVENLILVRSRLRQGRKWQQADMIRVKLAEAGITLEDTPQGTTWKRKR